MADDLTRYMDAIASVESAGSGGYSAVGPTTPKGDRAYGRYQVMGSNVPAWTQVAIGQSMTPQDFLQNPQAQDAVFKQRFGADVNKYGNPQDAASVWFSGRPLHAAGNSSDGYLTTPQYVQRFNSALGDNRTPSMDPAQNPMQAALAQMAPAMQQAMQAQPQAQAPQQMSPGMGALNTAGNTLQRMGMWAMAPNNPSVLGNLGATEPSRHFVQIGTDELGNPRYGWVDPHLGTVTPIAGTGAETSGGFGDNLTKISAHIKSGGSTDDAINMVPAALRPDLAAMIKYQAVPSNLSRGGKQRDQLIQYAHAIDPNFDETQLPARVQFNKDLINPNTKIGGQFVKQGTALQTLGDLSEAGVGLDNQNGMLGLDAAATAQNAVRGAGQEQAAKIAGFNNKVGAYVGEKGQLLYPGSGGTHEERSAIAQPFSAYGSPSKLADALESELANEKARSDTLQRQITQNGLTRKVIGPEAQANIARVETAIKTLRARAAGGDSSSSSSAPTVTSIRQIK